ncbi:MAG: hypothetical protein ABJC39_11985 [Chloroflexota bacterium]
MHTQPTGSAFTHGLPAQPLGKTQHRELWIAGIAPKGSIEVGHRDNAADVG